MKKVTLGLKLLGAACLVTSASIIFSACGGGTATGTQPGTSAMTTNTKPAGNTTVPAVTTTSSTKKPVNTSITVSSVPSVQTAKPGDKFDVSVKVKTNQPSRGGQFSLKWDPSKVECVSAEQGSFFKDFAAANKGSLFVLPSDKAEADNILGVFPKTSDPQARLMISVTGATNASMEPLGATGEGDIWVLHMMVKSGVSGPVEFQLGEVILGDNNAEITKDMEPGISNGTITITP